MLQIARKIAPDARNVGEISRFAVAVGEAGEDAQDLGIALRAKRGEAPRERSPVERGIARRHASMSREGTNVVWMPKRGSV